jgi:hydrogenase maturation factor
VSACDPHGACITCGDVGVPMVVLRIDDVRELALCEAGDGQRETVETALVGPLSAGDEVLVHAGVALTRLAAG